MPEEAESAGVRGARQQEEEPAVRPRIPTVTDAASMAESRGKALWAVRGFTAVLRMARRISALVKSGDGEEEMEGQENEEVQIHRQNGRPATSQRRKPRRETGDRDDSTQSEFSSRQEEDEMPPRFQPSPRECEVIGDENAEYAMQARVMARSEIRTAQNPPEPERATATRRRSGDVGRRDSPTRPRPDSRWRQGPAERIRRNARWTA